MLLYSTGSHTLQRCSACTGLCCGPQLAQALVTGVARTDWGREVLLRGTITICSQNTDLFQAPRRKQASVSHTVHLPTKASLQTDSGVEPFCTNKHLSSFASLSWTRDFFTQVMLESHRYAKTLSAMVKISWGKGQLTLRCPSHGISRSSYHGIWTGMLLAGHLSCKRKSKYVQITLWKPLHVYRVTYMLIVLIWGPSTDSLKEAGADKTSILLLNFTGSLYSGKHTWKAAQLYYILMNSLSTPGMCFKHSNWGCIK